MEWGASCVAYRWERQTTLIADSRGGHGMPPLGVPEQAPLVAPITSEEGTAIEYYLLLLSLPWELTLLLTLPNALGTL